MKALDGKKFDAGLHLGSMHLVSFGLGPSLVPISRLCSLLLFSFSVDGKGQGTRHGKQKNSSKPSRRDNRRLKEHIRRAKDRTVSEKLCKGTRPSVGANWIPVTCDSNVNRIQNLSSGPGQAPVPSQNAVELQAKNKSSLSGTARVMQFVRKKGQ